MRKTEIVVATAGRDATPVAKRFVITEMPALKAERWAYRALLALAHAGAELPEEVKTGGMAAIARAGMQALQNLNYEDAGPLLDEMLTCIQVMPDPKNPSFVRPLVMNEMEGDDIEEIATLIELRRRWFDMHTAFFFKG
jgi:hypothetical protein